MKEYSFIFEIWLHEETEKHAEERLKEIMRALHKEGKISDFDGAL